MNRCCYISLVYHISSRFFCTEYQSVTSVPTQPLHGQRESVSVMLLWPGVLVGFILEHSLAEISYRSLYKAEIKNQISTDFNDINASTSLSMHWIPEFRKEELVERVGALVLYVRMLLPLIFLTALLSHFPFSIFSPFWSSLSISHAILTLSLH